MAVHLFSEVFFTDEMERLRAEKLVERSETVERLAVAREMLWRSRQLLAPLLKEEPIDERNAGSLAWNPWRVEASKSGSSGLSS